MPPYEFVGTVKALPATKTFPSGFTKREVVVTSEEDRFPQDIAFEFVKEKAAMLDGIQEADRVRIFFDLRGREYNGRYFNSLKGWKIEKVGDTAQAAPEPAAASPAGRAPMPKDVVEDDDNLPF